LAGRAVAGWERDTAQSRQAGRASGLAVARSRGKGSHFAALSARAARPLIIPRTIYRRIALTIIDTLEREAP
jgi:hypothetical protein